MATAKKPSTTKKPAAKRTTTTRAAAAKKAPVRKTTAAKPVAKKAPAKKPAAKSASTRASTKKSAAKQQQMRSFRIHRENQEFTRFAITKQTVYWIILVAFIIFAQLWILKLQVEVAGLIEAQQAQLVEL